MGARCWEETRPDPEGVKPAKGERGKGRVSRRNGTRHSMVQLGRRGRKVSRRRKRPKEDARAECVRREEADRESCRRGS
ncbi:hypothetical protein NDU88_004083 [Pleurodeles waltl]|uniref:Uncharacterized protein n=1 Tax=Pleurodeles waltl TaxID=8319 RepID=A0AAV7LKA6_PLEWA|nr:hypothetical protein NDU88_004083 [Pleurodeles waltl]